MSTDSEELQDTGDFLHVPEDQRLDYDKVFDDEINEDEFEIDFSHVPDGEVTVLSTADLDDDFDDAEAAE